MKSASLLVMLFSVINIFAQYLPIHPVTQGKNAKFRTVDIGTNIFGFMGWDHQRYRLSVRKTNEGNAWMKASISFFEDVEDTKWMVVESSDTTIESKSWNIKTNQYQINLGLDWL
ncbi:MAG: hypothetical protein JKY54_00430, partial [Flavobacteriales bacterium]|nr:hypothetical protein [Flavobacteriales bacterium]